MAIEYRRGQPYYYRKKRSGERVVSEYVCGGALAVGVAELAEDDRIERDAATDHWRAEQKRLEDEDRAFADDFDRVEAQVREILTSAGYHQPKGRWRKRRAQAEEVARHQRGDPDPPQRFRDDGPV